MMMMMMILSWPSYTPIATTYALHKHAVDNYLLSDELGVMMWNFFRHSVLVHKPCCVGSAQRRLLMLLTFFCLYVIYTQETMRNGTKDTEHRIDSFDYVQRHAHS